MSSLRCIICGRPSQKTARLCCDCLYEERLVHAAVTVCCHSCGCDTSYHDVVVLEKHGEEYRPTIESARKWQSGIDSAGELSVKDDPGKIRSLFGLVLVKDCDEMYVLV